MGGASPVAAGEMQPITADNFDEPIFELALKCGRQFEKALSIDETTESTSTRRFLEEYQRRFWAWARYVGAFAAGKASLDWRLRRNHVYRDLFLLALSMLRVNIHQLLPEDAKSVDSIESNESEESDSQSVVFEGVDEAISQLNNLGMSMRQLSSSSSNSKVKAFAAKIPDQLNKFELLATLAVERLYPDAAPSLRQRLCKHMIYTYLQLCYWKSHADKLSTDRTSQNRPDQHTEQQPLATNLNATKVLLEVEDTQIHKKAISETEASTIPSQYHNPMPVLYSHQEVKETIIGEASTVVASKVTIPPPPTEKDNNLCWYCRKVYPAKFYQNSRWWRKHTNHDLQPYICLSDFCMGQKKFPDSKLWAKHMISEHGDDWAFDIHESPILRCSRTDGDHKTTLHFATPSILIDHWHTAHPDGDSTQSRGGDIFSDMLSVSCPFCYRALEGDISPSNKSAFATTPRNIKVKWARDLDDEPSKQPRDDKKGLNLDNTFEDENYIQINKALSRHIAEHLQFLALLTLRLQSEVFEGNDTLKHETDHNSDIFTVSERSTLLKSNSDTNDLDEWRETEYRQNPTEDVIDDIPMRLREETSEIFINLDRKEYLETLEAISDLNYTNHHSFIKDKRTPDTGKWLLKTTQFAQWEVSKSSVILLLYGSREFSRNEVFQLYSHLSAGMGKTFLISRVLDYLIDSSHVCHDKSLAYFYCRRGDLPRQEPVSILRSLVRQLASPWGQAKIHRDVQGLLKKLRLQRATLDMKMCQGLLVKFIKSYSQTTIVIDGLDECHTETRAELMNCFAGLMDDRSNLKLLISSRKDGDIVRFFRLSPIIEIEASDNENDISVFVNTTLAKDARWTDLRPEMQRQVIKLISTKSHGIFQWAALQVNLLIQLPFWGQSLIQQRLHRLPRSLMHSYDEIWENIMVNDDRNLALCVLGWVFCSRNPLSTNQLSSALIIDLHDEGSLRDKLLTADKIYTREMINELCGNLLTFDNKEQLWHFSHPSVLEYMENKHFEELQLHRYVAMACMKLLTDAQIVYDTTNILHQDLISRHRSDAHHNEDSYNAGLWLCNYAMNYWGYHVKAHDTSNGPQHRPIMQLVEQFLGPMYDGSKIYLLWIYEIQEGRVSLNGRYSSPGRELISQPFPPLFGICALGLVQVLRNWYAENPNLNLNSLEQNEDSELSILGIAITFGHEDMCRCLLDLGIDVDLGTPSPIWHAASIQNKTLLEDLIRRGADINTVFKGMSLLQMVVSECEGHGRIVQFLLENGADPNFTAKNGYGYSSTLNMALERNFGDIALMLFDHGANFSDCDLALQSAAKWGLENWITICIHSGANVDTYTEDTRKTPLMTAAEENHLHIIKSLLSMGADVNLVIYTEGGSPNKPGTALTTAISKFHLDAIRLFIDVGADPNLVDMGGTPLMWAANASNRSQDRLEIAKILLESGADIELTGGKWNESALVGAIRNCDTYMISLFLYKGADPNFCNGKTTPLITAASTFHGNRKQTIKLLLDYGADVNRFCKAGIFSTVLNAAVSYMDIEVVKLLLDGGADPNLGNKSGYPLSIALHSRKREIWDLLIAAGASPPGAGLEYDSYDRNDGDDSDDDDGDTGLEDWNEDQAHF